MFGSDQTAYRFGDNPPVLINRLPAENGPDDFACQRASEVRGLLVAVEQIRRSEFERMLEVYQSKIRVGLERDLTFGGGQPESFSDVHARQFRDERQSHVSLRVTFGQQQRQGV